VHKLKNCVKFDFSGCGIGLKALLAQAKKSSKYVQELSSVAKAQDWSNPACSLILPNERKFLKQSASLAQKYPHCSLLIVVGIGGSNLGAMAVLQAISGPYSRLLSIPQVLFADTCDARTLSQIISIGKRHIREGNSILISIITKSGRTIETISNFGAIYSALKKEGGKIHVVATSDEGSEFLQASADAGFDTLPIPKKAGGRYSVFSNAGLFPLALAGVDTSSLLAGAKFALTQSLSQNMKKNHAALMASFLHAHYEKGKNIHTFFFFSNSMRSLGMWNRQLLAESIGKEKNIAGKKINAGITPAVSIGTTDLHSMAQLYLAGPADKTFLLASVKHLDPVSLAGESPLSIFAPQKAKSPSSAMDAIYSGVRSNFKKEKLPFVEAEFPHLREFCIGQYMQTQMCATMLLANMLSINAFDQPAVENYKKEATRLLK